MLHMCCKLVIISYQQMDHEVLLVLHTMENKTKKSIGS